MENKIIIPRKEYKSRFKNTKFLGKGITSMVFLTLDKKLNKEIVCKYVDLTHTNTYYKEPKILETLKGTEYITNIIEYYDVKRDDEKLRIHTVYTPNLLSLYDLVFMDRITYSNLIDIFIMISKGIKNAHDKGIIHRDIKLENILVQLEDDEVITIEIIDWGFSCFVDDGNDKISGSIHYIAKELLCDSDVGVYNDVWSLGVLFFCGLTKNFPFLGKDYRDVFHSIKNTKPEYLYVTDFKMRILIDNMLKDVEERISLDDVIDYLIGIKTSISD